MQQTWLRPNQRALALSTLVPVSVLLGGVVLIWLAPAGWYGRGVGMGLVVLAALALAGLLWGLFMPRLAYRDGQLLVYLRLGRAEPVPVEAVECFFRGEGPAGPRRILGGQRGGECRRAKVCHLVVRLAESARTYHQRQVDPRFGEWRDGYITIRGTWCEPLTRDVFQRLNGQLVECHRRRGAS